MKKDISRRNFFSKTSRGLTGLALLSAAGSYPLSVFASSQKKSKKLNPGSICEFGVEGSAPQNRESFDLFLKSVKDLGAGFLVCQFAPKRVPVEAKTNDDTWQWGASDNDFEDFSLGCKKYNLSFFINQECTNYSQKVNFWIKMETTSLHIPIKLTGGPHGRSFEYGS